MNGLKETKRPGYGFVERYMPDASQAERDAAYENLCDFVQAILRVIDSAISKEDAKVIRHRGAANIKLEL